MKNLTRRSAIKKTLQAAAAVSAPMFLSPSVLGLGGRTGPNSRITIGLIGHGKIMKGHRQYHLGRDSVEVVALCDVDQRKLDMALAEVKEKTGKVCPTYEYHEELCARSDIDGVVVGTPDHWHAQISIEAMKNGKDVYVEKPMTLTIEEGKVMRETLHRYGSVLQVGSQQRSNASLYRPAWESFLRRRSIPRNRFLRDLIMTVGSVRLRGSLII
jgi:hypothetical protein